MSVLYLVVPLALIVVGVAVWGFVWAAGRGQFDDLDTPALRMLRDDGDASVQPLPAPEAAPAATSRPRTASGQQPNTE